METKNANVEVKRVKNFANVTFLYTFEIGFTIS